MTEKRFEYVAFDGFTDNGKYITPHEVADLLNELAEENEELEIELETLRKKYNDFSDAVNKRLEEMFK